MSIGRCVGVAWSSNKFSLKTMTQKNIIILCDLCVASFKKIMSFDARTSHLCGVTVKRLTQKIHVRFWIDI